MQTEEQKAIELQIDLQVREERAYRERLAAQGVDIEEDTRRNRSSADQTPGRINSYGSVEPTESPVSDGSGPSPSALHLSTSPRLAPPIGAEEEYERRWYQAQQQQGEQALLGSDAASPQMATAEWQGEHQGRSGDGDGRAWESELEDLMLMEAIRLSLNSAGDVGATHGGDMLGERVTQLAAQVERSIREQTLQSPDPAAIEQINNSSATEGFPEPMILPPAIPMQPTRAATDAPVSAGEYDEAFPTDNSSTDGRISPHARREAWGDDGSGRSPPTRSSSLGNAQIERVSASRNMEEVHALDSHAGEGSSRTSAASLDSPMVVAQQAQDVTQQAEEEPEGVDDASPVSDSHLTDFDSQLQLALALSLSMANEDGAEYASAAPTSADPADPADPTIGSEVVESTDDGLHEESAESPGAMPHVVTSPDERIDNDEDVTDADMESREMPADVAHDSS